MMQPAPPGGPQATPTTAPQQHQPEASAASAAATTTSAADASSGSQGSTAASSSPAPPPQPPPPPRVQNGAAAAATAAAAADDGGASSDYESANSEDDFAEIEPSQFSSFVVIFGSRKKAHIRAKEKAHGTQWDCDDCSQPNSILDYVCTACGMMDLDLLELGDGEAVSEMRRAAAEERQKAEETKRREEEERARKERAARIAKSKSLQQKRSNLANLQNKMEDMKKLLKQKEQQKQQRTTTGGPESPLHPSSGPCTPVKTAQAGASGPGAGGAGTAGGSGAGGGAGSGAASGGSAVGGGGGGGGTSSFANVSPSPVPELSTPTKREAVTEGPALPPHLLAARRAREAPSAGNDATPPRDGPISAPPSLKDDDDRRDRRRRRSDSEEKGRTRRSERDRHSDRDRRRRGDDPRDRDHARDRVGSDKARRPSGGGIEGLKNLITSTVGGSGGGGGGGGGGTGSSSDVHSPADSSASNRLSSGGVKRMLSPDARDGKVRKVETPKGVPSTLGTARTSKLRMDAYGGGDGYDREKRDEKRERSDSPPVKRGRGASKWTGAGTTAAGAATGAASAAGSSGAGGRREEGDSSVAMVTCASGRKIFQPKRLGGDGLDERGGAKLPLSVAALSPAGSGGAGAAAGATSGNSPLSAAASLQHGPLSSAAPAAGDGRDVWREKLAGVNLDGAEELAPGHDVLQCSGGVVNFIATHGGRRAFVNPYTEGVINAYASSTASGHISAVLTPRFSAEGTFATGWPETGRSSFIAFDFCDYEVLPTQYTLGHAWEHPQNYIRSWSLRASEDNYKWDILAKHSNDDSIQEGHEVATFKLVPQETLKFYRYFMIRMEPKGNSRRNGQLVASCFELYGHCRKASRRT